MMVSVESADGLERRMRVQVPADRVESEIDSRLERVGRTAKIKGFRPGKVPMRVIRQRYGDQVRQEVLGEIMQATYFEALTQEKLRPAGGPRIEANNTSAGEDLDFTAVFEVYPELEVKGLDGLAITRPTVEIGESDLEDMIERLRRQRATWEAEDKAAEDGDRITVDFDGTIDGEAFSGGQGEEVPIVIGRGGMLEDFEAGLRGMSAGDEKEIPVAFPESYGATQLAGKTALFKVKARQVEVERLPELDDEFARGFAVEDGSIETFRKEVADNMQREADQAVRGRLRDAAFKALLEANPDVDLPQVLVEEEIRSLRQDAARRMGGGDDAELPPREPFEDEGRRRVALGLLVGEVIRQAKIELDQGKVRERLQAIAAGTGQPEATLKLYAEHRQLMAQVENQVLEDQVLDWLLDQATLTDEPVAFADLMNPA